MARILEEVSRTFSEYLLVPRLTGKKHLAKNVSIAAPAARFKKGKEPPFSLNIPFVSASMQSVSGPDMAIALSRLGGLAFIYCSQPVEQQAAMVQKVKMHKAGFVPSDSNVKPITPLTEAVALIKRTGHSTMPVTHDGSGNGEFLGILTDKDFWEFEDDLTRPVSEFMTPKKNVVYGTVGISLLDANILLRKQKKECLPVLDKEGRLHSLVFKKDYIDHMKNPDE
ncbi:MAG: IMP dehydrogenase, partial [Chitinispirillaceae bacterium]|nr:IMP dehydrogenase [Chitinispirillaceae bacterium]